MTAAAPALAFNSSTSAGVARRFAEGCGERLAGKPEPLGQAVVGRSQDDEGSILELRPERAVRPPDSSRVPPSRLTCGAAMPMEIAWARGGSGVAQVLASVAGAHWLGRIGGAGE